MHFSVIKEVGWEADDESESPKQGLGVKKRYRFILDFSRRSPKNTGNNKRGSSRLGLSDHYAESDEDDDGSDSYQHSCYCCGATRSSKYHEDHPLKRNKLPRPSLCTRCRFHRRRRLDNRARDGSRRRHVTKTEARTDEREWCGDCGTLRSNKYHAKLASGELSPDNDVCGFCIVAAERKNRPERLRVYCKESAMAGGSDSEKHDPLRDSLQRRRSSPYALTPTFSFEQIKLGSPTTSASSFETQVGRSDESGRDEQSPTVTTSSETKPASYRGAKVSEPAKADIRKTTVEDDISEDHREHVQAEGQVRQEIRETRQSQETQPSTRPGQQEKRHGLPQQPEPKPRVASTTASIPVPAPQPATSGNTKQRQEVSELAPKVTENRDYFRPRSLKRPEPREQPTMKAQPREASARTTSDNTAQRQQDSQVPSRASHRKQLSTSSAAKPPRAQEEPQPFYFRNPNPAHKSEPNHPQAQPKPKQHPPKPTAPPPRPMGVSDMYWASAAGQAETEQTFTSGGSFFSAGMYDAFTAAPSGAGSRAQQEQQQQGKTEKRGEQKGMPKLERRHQHHDQQRGFGFGSSSSSSRHRAPHEHGSAAAQVWEVDSDEAEEIEQARVRLLGGEKVKGKARRA